MEGNKIYNALFSSQKVELGLTQEALSAYNDAIMAEKQAIDRAKTIRSEKAALQGDIAKVMDAKKELDTKLSKIQSASKELGVDIPKNIASLFKLSEELRSRYDKLIKEFDI